MAERVTKHCWATPKCGISFVQTRFVGIEKPIDYVFLIIRNPYDRLISFYVNKIIYQGDPPWDIKDNYPSEIGIPHIGGGDTSVSFEHFIRIVNSIDVNRCERHLKAQNVGIRSLDTFSKIVRLETFKEDIKEPCEVLGLDYDKITEKKHNFFERTEINEPVYDKPTSWFRENGIPKNYDVFWTEELKEIVYKKYQKDFELLGYSK